MTEVPPGGEERVDEISFVEEELMERRRRFGTETFDRVAEKNRPWEVVHSTRNFTARLIRDWINREQPPNEYNSSNVVLPQIDDRVTALRESLPLGDILPTEEDIRANLVAGEHWLPISQDELLSSDPEELNKDIEEGRIRHLGKEKTGFFYRRVSVSEETAERSREALASALDMSAKEIAAWVKIISKLKEQDDHSGDAKAYAFDRFQKYWKLRMETENYFTVLNSPESREGFERFGEKIEAAFESLIDVAEGRAFVNLRPIRSGGTQVVIPETKAIPNPWAMARNKGAINLALSYASNKLGLTTPEPADAKGRALRRAEIQDNLDAARAALILFEHWDYDSWYQLGIRGFERNVDQMELTPADVELLDIEGAYNDAFRFTYVALRRVGELRGDPGNKEGVRPHPRKAGPPATVDCFPILSAPVLELVPCQVLAYNKDKPDEREIIRISVSKAVFGNRFNKGKFEVERDGGTWVYEKRRLGDRRNWDSISVIDPERNELIPLEQGMQMWPLDLGRMSKDEIRKAREAGVFELAQGASTNAFEIPYGLEMYFAYQIYVEATRADYLEQLKEYTGTDKLLSLNKVIDITLGMMAEVYNLDKETSRLLNDYVRVMLIAGLGSAIIERQAAEDSESYERAPQVPHVVKYGKKDTKIVLEDVCRTYGFLTFIRGGGKIEMAPHQKALFDYIIDKRAAPRPGQLRKLIPGWFSEEQEEKIAFMYPLGIR